jgi:hypothetical protein
LSNVECKNHIFNAGFINFLFQFNRRFDRLNTFLYQPIQSKPSQNIIQKQMHNANTRRKRMNKINILQQPHISYPMIRNPLKPIFRILRS